MQSRGSNGRPSPRSAGTGGRLWKAREGRAAGCGRAPHRRLGLWLACSPLACALACLLAWGLGAAPAAASEPDVGDGAADACVVAAPQLAAIAAAAPAWADLRMAVPAFPSPEPRYPTLGQIAGFGRSFAPDNLSKLRYLAPTLGPDHRRPALDFSRVDAQIFEVQLQRCAPAPFDLHGAIWHRSVPDGLAALLRAAPAETKGLIDHILSESFAHRDWRSLDVNEVFMASGEDARLNDEVRGPIEPVPGHPSRAVGRFGSIWYEGFARAIAADPEYWPHGAGYWWLAMVDWANRAEKKVLLQDFSIEAGRPWGLSMAPPAGYEDAKLFRGAAEMRKRRRMLDAVNYAAHHGFEIDALAFQMHLDPNRVIDEADLGGFLRSIVSLGLDVEVTELDVYLRGGPIGAADDGAEARAFAAAYAARYLDLMLTETPMTLIGGWTGWTAPDDAGVRLAMVDKTGLTELGAEVLASLDRAAAPEARTLGPVSRRYNLVGGVRGEIWRAARDQAAPGFQAEAGYDGTAPRPGSGGAALALIPLADQPDRIPPYWRGEGAAQPYDPARMALAFQWREADARGGARLQLRRGGEPVAEIRREGRGFVIVAGGERRRLGRARTGAYARAALSWTGGRLTVAFRDERSATRPAVAALPLAAAPDEVVLLGDGRRESRSLATLLEVFRDPFTDAALARWSRLEGAATPSAAEILAGAPAGAGAAR